MFKIIGAAPPEPTCTAPSPKAMSCSGKRPHKATSRRRPAKARATRSGGKVRRCSSVIRPPAAQTNSATTSGASLIPNSARRVTETSWMRASSVSSRISRRPPLVARSGTCGPAASSTGRSRLLRRTLICLIPHPGRYCHVRKGGQVT